MDLLTAWALLATGTIGFFNFLQSDIGSQITIWVIHNNKTLEAKYPIMVHI